MLVQPLIWRIVSGTPSPTSQIVSGNVGLTCKPPPILDVLFRNCGRVLHMFMTEIRCGYFPWIHSIPNMTNLSSFFLLGQMMISVLSKRSYFPFRVGTNISQMFAFLLHSGAGEVVGRKTRASYGLRIALQKRLQVVSLGWHWNPAVCRYGLRNVFFIKSCVCACVSVGTFNNLRELHS